MAALINLKKFFVKEKTFTSIIGIVILVAIINPYFLSFSNLVNLFMQVGIYGIVALGMTFAIIGGEFDLSVGSQLSLVTVLIVVLQPIIGLLLAIIATTLIAMLIGLINGLLVAKARINSFIVTFGAMVLYKGVALTIANGRPVISESETLNKIGDITIFGLPLLFIIFIALLVISNYILRYTKFGRNIFATGGNEEVASDTGINTKFYKISLFVITSFFVAITGVLLAARMNSGSPIQGDGMELTAIASVVIGGTSLSGGKGSIIRTLLGVFIMMILTNAFDVVGVQPYIQRVIKGLIIISVVAVDKYNKIKLPI